MWPWIAFTATLFLTFGILCFWGGMVVQRQLELARRIDQAVAYSASAAREAQSLAGWIDSLFNTPRLRPKWERELFKDAP